METIENKYSKVEGILYSRPKLPYEIKNLEIEIKMIECEYEGLKGHSENIKESTPTNKITSTVEAEVESKDMRITQLKKQITRKQLLIDKVDNALEVLDEREYLLIKLRYIDGLEFKQIAAQIPMDENSLMRKRSDIIKNKLINMLG